LKGYGINHEDTKAQRRCVVVNADDFGLSEAVNDGVAQAHEKGILSSASLMIDAPAAAAAIAYSNSHPRLSLGLHVDLGCWVWRDGEWIEQYRIVNTSDPAAVAGEVARQIKAFQTLAGRNPTHLDSHQHIHREDPARSALLEAARTMNVPLRLFTPKVSYCGSYYGQTKEGRPMHWAISVDALIDILVALPPGITELGCHPALGQDVGDPVYCVEREQELRALCDPAVRKTLAAQRIEIRSFSNVGNSWWKS
jgi:predicted glycoside hydrolase/deacetylase ChbG (UPF0249 family)